ncbi:isoprenylcysteine carboxylmethyltransferase family protein [Microbacterium sp. LRZ72]|uniref:methyltransferase family protein n=1 Tax=Microbacterium sp. LRZ72 TaxID=2942481 RepID=UPI0029BC0F24|nr:isoprenylcysteine carboxylmethyltransferase family protein [Microbacterium sp. LRZ72]MDX2377787.1 isoprenylcysteine carboxylmethyltransferase family protein [Microbacterium sp. LRZ72]
MKLIQTITLSVSAPILLRRMKQEIRSQGTLSGPTAAWMWATYGIHAALLLDAFATATTAPPLAKPVRGTLQALTVAGMSMCLAGMRRFASPAQLSGTDVGELVTGGIYRYNRNPQYLGAVVALFATSALRRSVKGALLTGALMAAYRVWVPIEENHLHRQFGSAYRRYMAAPHDG